MWYRMAQAVEHFPLTMLLVFVSGTAPTMSTAANAIDLLVYNARTTTAISQP